jgi:hypothetical protein
MTTNFFHLSLLLLFLDPGSGIRDPGWVKIRIRDKHPGYATLDFLLLISVLKAPSSLRFRPGRQPIHTGARRNAGPLYLVFIHNKNIFVKLYFLQAARPDN